MVASSGHLGITFGVIRPQGNAAATAARGASFFTVWRRGNGVWRSVAE
jgi:hypothetical protein